MRKPEPEHAPRVAVIAATVLWLLSSCESAAPVPCPDSPDECPGGADGGPTDAGPAPPADELDLLLAIDNSNSMAGEQRLFGAELERLVRAIESGDANGDGVQDFPGVRSLHVGVVTSDMGGGPFVPAGEVVPSCENGLGDDGILRTIGNTTLPGCVTEYPTVFEFRPPDARDAVTFARDVGCVAVAGTRGCGFEQQLEALFKAVAASSPTATYVGPGYVPALFAGMTRGHGDNTNTGIIRASSVLAILVVTDEEDCSVPDYSLFYRDPRFTAVGLGLRCFSYPERLYPIERYAEGLLALRPYPSQLVFGGIVGIPSDIVASSVAEYDRALLDPRMIETPDPSTTPPGRLLRSCATSDGGEALPPRRIVSVARDLARRGAHTTMQSVCADDFGPGIDAFVAQVALALSGE